MLKTEVIFYGTRYEKAKTKAKETTAVDEGRQRVDRLVTEKRFTKLRDVCLVKSGINAPAAITTSGRQVFPGSVTAFVNPAN